MKIATAFLAFLLMFTVPLISVAGRGGGRGGGAARPSGGRSAAPASRPAPQPASRPNTGGYNLNRDVNASRPPAAPSQLPSNTGGNRNNVNTGGNRNNVNTGGNRNTINTGGGNTINRGVVVANPIYGGGAAWGWNRGVAWVPAGAYWGGGFWGPWAIGVTTAAIWGTIVYSGTTYTSYSVEPSSPGATVLTNYKLTQTQCGPPNLVAIWGPSDSVICAYPNDLVAVGNYQIETSTLSLVSK